MYLVRAPCSGISGKIRTMLKNTAVVAYLVYIVLLTSSAVYLRCFVENWLILVRFLTAKVEPSNENVLDFEGSGECAHYRVPETEEGHAEEGIIPLGQSSLRLLKTGFPLETIFEVMMRL